MLTKRFVAVVAIGMLSGTPTANSALIVDTGSPTGSTLTLKLDLQYFAGKFSVASDLAINSVEGLFSNDFGADGSVTASINSNAAGGIPGTALFSQAIPIGAGVGLDWRGPTGLNWIVGPGDYWVVFTPDAKVWGQIGGLDVPIPMIDYAQYDPGYLGGTWFLYDNVQIAVRINASAVSAVPAPATLALFGLGLAGLGAVRQKKLAA